VWPIWGRGDRPTRNWDVNLVGMLPSGCDSLSFYTSLSNNLHSEKSYSVGKEGWLEDFKPFPPLPPDSL
jgi:hypothetical protein